MTICDLATILKRPFLQFGKYIKSFDLGTLFDLVTVFAETNSVNKSKLHCTLHNNEYQNIWTRWEFINTLFTSFISSYNKSRFKKDYCSLLKSFLNWYSFLFQTQENYWKIANKS